MQDRAEQGAGFLFYYLVLNGNWQIDNNLLSAIIILSVLQVPDTCGGKSTTSTGSTVTGITGTRRIRETGVIRGYGF